MRRKNRDHIIVESAKVGSARRSGQIVEVLQGSAGEHYRVQWDDGHQTSSFPAQTPWWFQHPLERWKRQGGWAGVAGTLIEGTHH
jgi:hypothetical protein